MDAVPVRLARWQRGTGDPVGKCYAAITRRPWGRTSPADIPPLRFSPGAAPAPSRRICFDRLPFDLAAEKIRPQKFAERGGVLGKTARSPQLAGEATERIVLQLHDGLRDVGKIPAAALRVEGINQALVIEHGPKGVGVQRAQVEHNGDENVPQSLFVQRE